MASLVIKSGIETLENHLELLEDASDEVDFAVGTLERITVGSVRRPISISKVASSTFTLEPDRSHAFKDLRKKTAAYLQAFLLANTGTQTQVKLATTHEVCQSSDFQLNVIFYRNSPIAHVDYSIPISEGSI